MGEFVLHSSAYCALGCGACKQEIVPAIQVAHSDGRDREKALFWRGLGAGGWRRNISPSLQGPGRLHGY